LLAATRGSLFTAQHDFTAAAGVASALSQPHWPHSQVSQVQNSPLQSGQAHSTQPQPFAAVPAVPDEAKTNKPAAKATAASANNIA
jgi:hypothetical protein